MGQSALKVGDRVGAVTCVEADKVFLLGFGVYEGEQPAPFGPNGIPLDVFSKSSKAREGRYLEARATLDDGRQVWHSECYLLPEDRVRQFLRSRDVVPVNWTERSPMERWLGAAVVAREPDSGGKKGPLRERQWVAGCVHALAQMVRSGASIPPDVAERLAGEEFLELADAADAKVVRESLQPVQGAQP